MIHRTNNFNELTYSDIAAYVWTIVHKVIITLGLCGIMEIIYLSYLENIPKTNCVIWPKLPKLLKIINKA